MKYVVVVIAIGLAGCTRSSPSDGDGLEMKSESAVCKRAMRCCEARVSARKPGELKRLCSGVAQATEDRVCEAFHQGYVASFELKKQPVPTICR